MRAKEFIREYTDVAISPVGSIVSQKKPKVNAKKRAEEIAKQLKSVK